MLQEKPRGCKSHPALTRHPSWEHRWQRHDAPVPGTVLLLVLTVGCRIALYTLQHNPSIQTGHCSLQLTSLPVSHHVVFAIEGPPADKAGKHGFHITGVWSCATMSLTLSYSPKPRWPKPTQSQVAPQSCSLTVSFVTPVTRVPPYSFTDKIGQTMGGHLCVFNRARLPQLCVIRFVGGTEHLHVII